MTAETKTWDELEAMADCLGPLYRLTPAERQRATGWLFDRVHDDIATGQAAARSVGAFLRAAVTGRNTP